MRKNKNFRGIYSSIHDFISTHKLEAEAKIVFGNNWEADNDIEQVQRLIEYLKKDYTVTNTKVGGSRGERLDNYILVEKNKRGKLLQTTYKLWVVVEEIKTYENDETYKDLKECDGGETYSVGEFDALDEAIDEMRILGREYSGRRD